MAIQVKDGGTKGFLVWLKLNQPLLYREFLKRWNRPEVSGTMSGLGDIDVTSGLAPISVGMPTIDPATSTTSAATDPSLADMLKNLTMGAAQIYLTKTQLDNQSKILDTQLSRAKAGLPPLNIDPANYGLQPTIGVGISPQTKTFLMWGGLGIGALFLLGMFGRRRA